jgi:predicted dehydrogenase
MKLRLGFIGLGAMGLSHVRSFHAGNSADAEAVALCASNPENIRKALEIAPGARVFAEPRDLIASDLDAVVVSTPNLTHVPLAMETLRAKKHLFLEKPVGITGMEARDLSAAAARSARVVMIGHELRYSPYFQKIKSLVSTGEIGAPRMVWCREFRGPFQKKSRDWIQDDRMSGGCLVDKNCHHFDMMNWWVGSRPKHVCAFGGNAVNRVIEGEHQVHDHATVNFEYANGVRGTLQLCMFARDFPQEDLEMGIVGDSGMLQTRISNIEILQWKRGTSQVEPLVHSVASPRGEGWGGHLGFNEMHAAFIEAILRGGAILTGVSDCLDGTLLAIAAEESIRDRQVVEIR